MVTAGDLFPTIKKLAVSYLEEIGSTDQDQTSILMIYLNHALRKLAHIAYQQKDSDLLTISVDGYVQFKKGGSVITNMYSPLRIIGPDGWEINKRTSFTDTQGWWRESSNSDIHIKGFQVEGNPFLPGDYLLQYLAYPALVTDSNSTIEFPEAGTMGLCYHSAALIMESLPSAKDLAVHYYTLSMQYMKIAAQANIDARGQSSGGFVPSLFTIDQAFKG